MKSKKKIQRNPDENVPNPIVELFEEIDGIIDDETADDVESYVAKLNPKWELLKRAIRELADDLKDDRDKIDALKGKIDDLEEELESGATAKKLAAFEDPANWRDGNRWVPVLTSMTSDPLLFIERGY
jgi:septal ring factor EnvC (AmiA/AmiB activator)